MLAAQNVDKNISHEAVIAESDCYITGYVSKVVKVSLLTYILQ